MKTTKNQNTITRRRFLGGTAFSAATFMILPGSVLGLRGSTSANGKLNLAGIGIGGQGGNDIGAMAGENIVALCDVDQNYAAPIFKKFPDARKFTDFRRMLDEMKDIDGVVIGTPDHLHAFATMEAVRRGKHVYCEKPLTHSVWEARRVAEAAREAKVATQMGNQGQASEPTRRLCELVWSGAIGPVREAHIWTDRPAQGLFNEYWPQGINRPNDEPPVPATLDWNLWLGPAPQRPYHPAYLPFKWRGWWDFGTGALGDIGCHAMDPVFRALKLGVPISVQASSTRVNTETYPLGSMVTYHFPARTETPQEINRHVQGLSGKMAGGFAMPACKLVWYDGGLRPPRPDALPQHAPMGDNGRLLIGDDGFILENSVFPEARAKEVEHLAKNIPRSNGHYEEWLAACKGGVPAGSNFDWAGPLTEAVLLGNVALRSQLRENLTLMKLLWDGTSLKFSNSDEANKFLRREYRTGWTL